MPVTEDYVLRTWEIDDGLPSNRILNIAQTVDGYLWLATPRGLARFDGIRFAPFGERLSAGEDPLGIPAVLAARDGSLWIGSDRGQVGRWLDGRLELVATGSTAAVNAFAEDGDGRIWFSTEGDPQVYRWDGQELKLFSSSEGLVVGSRRAHQTWVAATRSGQLWYSNTTGCGPFDGGRFEAVDSEAGGYVHLAPAGASGMWAIRDRSLVRYESGGRERSQVVDLGTVSVHVMMEDSGGTLWLGTNNAGLIRYRSGQFAKVQIEGAVLSLFEDDVGDIWVGTSAGGVIRLHERRFFLRQLKDGLRDDETYSLGNDAEGRMWLAGRNSMLVRGTDKTNRRFAPARGWAHEWGIMTLLPDDSGGVWLGTLAGVMRWRDGIVEREAFREPITALLTDRSGNLWMATTAGALAVRAPDGEYRKLDAVECPARVLALAEDGEGRIWAGGWDGRLVRRNQDRFEPVVLPGAGEGDMIRFIAPDRDDTVWIGVLGRGLYRWRAGSVTRLPENAGLPVDDLRSLIAGSDDEVWIGSIRGLFLVSKNELDAVMDRRASHLTARTYGRNDGLPFTEFALGFRGAVARTEDGHLWLATARGALDIAPRASAARTVERRPIIDEIWNGNVLVARGEPREVPEVAARPKSLKISYTLPRLSEAERLRFRYRLSGAKDDEWVDNGGQRTVTFSYLPAGSHRFEVMARMEGGAWIPGVATIHFRVLAAWWETPVARLGAVLVGAGIFGWLVRRVVLSRVRARILRLRQAHEVERERSRIARDMHDELGANLTHITMLSRLACMEPPESAGGHLEEIAGVARRTVDSLDEIVWAVNPRYDTLGALIEYLGMYAAGFLASAGIACETEQPARPPALPLSASARHHLFLAVKEALNNAAKHSGARCVRLLSEWDGGRLRVTVEDDGRGFDPERVEDSSSNGLRNQRERLAELGGTCRIESWPGAGARVVLELPLAADSSGVNPVSR